ncbi:MAG: oxidoreductase [Rhodobacteraceae bacterium]|nr:oxidoreductase [Paracoccaceae bacterium]
MMLRHFMPILTVIGMISPTFVHAEELASPTGRILLTVSGQITETNADGVAQFDLDMLRDLGVEEVQTTTIWTDGPQVFVGVSLDVLMDRVGASGSSIDASAINDYTVQIPLSDAVDGGPIVAFQRNGNVMSRREKGPLWLIYPFDSSADYRTEVIYSRSIWQLDRMAITQ